MKSVRRHVINCRRSNKQQKGGKDPLGKPLYLHRNTDKTAKKLPFRNPTSKEWSRIKNKKQ